MLHEFFGMQLVLRKKFIAAHPHKTVNLARLGNKRFCLFVAERCPVDIVVFIVNVGAAVKYGCVLDLE